MKFKAVVREVMKKDVITIDIEGNIKDAAELMRDHAIGSLVVVGEKNIKGIVTAEDIVYKHVAEGKHSKVSEIMSIDLVTIDPSKSIEEASTLMVKRGIKKLPVLEGDKMVGIITATDIVRVEPVLFEVLLESLRIGGGASLKTEKKGGPIEQCENCSNYVDDVVEVEGEWVCTECAEVGKSE